MQNFLYNLVFFASWVILLWISFSISKSGSWVTWIFLALVLVVVAVIGNLDWLKFRIISKPCTSNDECTVGEMNTCTEGICTESE
tara:strand:+ start:909 stop:1163 length:255 start_codon:yes stop_codon:yes gene_type:complete